MKNNYLKKLSNNLSKKIYNHAINNSIFFSKPFKHLIIENFLPIKLANLCRDSFPPRNNKTWHNTNDPGIEVKSRSQWKSEFDIPDYLSDVVRVLNSPQILFSMSKVLSIPKLMPDPYYTGGGLNVSYKGGHLDVHIDGNYHDASGMNRRVNLLIYFNNGWKEEYGGHFGLYDSKGEKLKKAIAPLHNRCIIFDTHDKSFHGLPSPINFPINNPRKSLLLYYYTVKERPQNLSLIKKPHSALWKSKNWNDKKGNKTRKYK